MIKKGVAHLFKNQGSGFMYIKDTKLLNFTICGMLFACDFLIHGIRDDFSEDTYNLRFIGYRRLPYFDEILDDIKDLINDRPYKKNRFRGIFDILAGLAVIGMLIWFVSHISFVASSLNQNPCLALAFTRSVCNPGTWGGLVNISAGALIFYNRRNIIMKNTNSRLVIPILMGFIIGVLLLASCTPETEKTLCQMKHK